MYTLDKIRLNIVKQINQALGTKTKVQASDLVYAPNVKFGDLSLPCFNLAKKFKKSSVETAEWLVRRIKTDKTIAAVKVIGPYLNFTINQEKLAEEVIEQISDWQSEYGRSKTGQGKKMSHYSD